MEIIIDNDQDKIDVTGAVEKLIKDVIENCFGYEGFTVSSEVSILLVDNDKIREINREQREIDRPTDVLSFPMVTFSEGRMAAEEGDYDLDGNLLLLGDIVISLEMAKAQAEEYGHTFERELAFLTTHGIFHLLGYDHENEADEKRMMDKQEAVLVHMGICR